MPGVSALVRLWTYCIPCLHLSDECDHISKRIHATVKTLSDGEFDYTRCTKILKRIDVAADALNDEWEQIQILLFIYSLLRAYQAGIRIFVLDDGGFRRAGGSLRTRLDLHGMCV